jgi:hypothetical protein
MYEINGIQYGFDERYDFVDFYSDVRQAVALVIDLAYAEDDIFDALEAAENCNCYGEDHLADEYLWEAEVATHHANYLRRKLEEI